MVPDAFSFIPQTGMPLNTMIISSPITVSGIVNPTSISISGGQYEINMSGIWKAGGDSVSPNDTVRVRLTSSHMNSAPTAATLTIGGVSAQFDVTTAAANQPTATGLVAWWRAENNAFDAVGGNHERNMGTQLYRRVSGLVLQL